MKKFLVVLCLWIFSNVVALANEISNIRASVFAEKTRIVFDLKDQPTYNVEIKDPYQVILHFDQMVSAPLKQVPTKNLGKIVESITPVAIGTGVSYVFNLKYAVSPKHAKLAPQGNYHNYRVYIDFINADLIGAPRPADHKLTLPKATVENTPKPKLNPDEQNKVNAITVLSPAEVEKKRQEMQRANEKQIAMLEAPKKQETVLKPNESQNNKKDPALNKSIEQPKVVEKPKENTDLKASKTIASQNNPKLEPSKNASPKNESNKTVTSTNNKNTVVASVANKKNEVTSSNNKSTTPTNNKNVATKNDNNKNASTKTTATTGCVASAKVIIAIDPGHGGKDPGAIGKGGTKEKNITLGVSKQLASLLNTTKDLKGVLTRSTDRFIELDDRSEIARKNNADILISIHADAAANQSAIGASVLVLNNDRAGRENRKMLNTKQKHDQLLGGASDVLEETALIGENDSYMQNMIIDLTSDKSRDAGYDLANNIIKELSKFATMHKKRPDERSLAVLKAPDIPSLLVETGFVSNPKEESLLKTSAYQKKIATAIYNALRNHLKNPKYTLSPERHCKKR